MSISNLLSIVLSSELHEKTVDCFGQCQDNTFTQVHDERFWQTFECSEECVEMNQEQYVDKFPSRFDIAVCTSKSTFMTWG